MTPRTSPQDFVAITGRDLFLGGAGGRGGGKGSLQQKLKEYSKKATRKPTQKGPSPSLQRMGHQLRAGFLGAMRKVTMWCFNMGGATGKSEFPRRSGLFRYLSRDPWLDPATLPGSGS